MDEAKRRKEAKAKGIVQEKKVEPVKAPQKKMSKDTLALLTLAGALGDCEGLK